eukprot:Tamp_16859.p1 GENE.Tamp_16859~~Tamp_16859.p1  ORF type:complete len:421 (+),score=95.39 Tamp_16859:134-1396(+)
MNEFGFNQMAWLFGGQEVDLSSAERAIDQLSQDRDAAQDQLTKLQEQAQQQKRRIEDMRRTLAEANQNEEQALLTLEGAQRTLQQRKKELMSVRARFDRACTLFSLQEEAEMAAAKLKSTKQLLFPTPLVLAGPVAVGKATLISRLLSEFGGKLALPICHTSRAPQQGEKNGYSFWFAEKDEMAAAAKGGQFLEIAELEGDLYGTSVQAVTSIRNAGQVAVMHLDLAGAQQLKASGLKFVSIWVHPPSLEKLKERLQAREELDTAVVAQHLSLAQHDLQQAEALGEQLFDYVIENDNLETAYSALRSIVLKLVSPNLPPSAESPARTQPHATPLSTPFATPAPAPASTQASATKSGHFGSTPALTPARTPHATHTAASTPAAQLRGEPEAEDGATASASPSPRQAGAGGGGVQTPMATPS